MMNGPFLTFFFTIQTKQNLLREKQYGGKGMKAAACLQVIKLCLCQSQVCLQVRQLQPFWPSLVQRIQQKKLKTPSFLCYFSIKHLNFTHTKSQFHMKLGNEHVKVTKTLLPIFTFVYIIYASLFILHLNYGSQSQTIGLEKPFWFSPLDKALFFSLISHVSYLALS